ncbi:hypothetical protein [Solirhodobacter olei]|uniref:hypothetical protein n=1 Tax=Solirhodobacter olei TaxID=2493082 RepID=UPI000FD91E7F|nr:hypothetical protein [Solirhodobacter olei]
MAEPSEPSTYVFTRDAVLRSIRLLETCKIHEHFPGYLAILRGLKSAEPGEPVRSKAIWDLHNRYLSVADENKQSVYVRPFASRGSRGLELFNPNVAGSYGASSIRARGKLSEVIEVEGEGASATYRLKDEHAKLARRFLLKGKVPVGALAAFFYRDYGFRLDAREVSRVIDLFRYEFGLSEADPEERKVFDTLFADDADSFTPEDLEMLQGGQADG